MPLVYVSDLSLLMKMAEAYNQIERWFAEITRKRIRRGTFRSVRDLIKAIKDYVRRGRFSGSPAQERSFVGQQYKETLETGDQRGCALGAAHGRPPHVAN